MLQALYTSPLRSRLRSLGITKFLRLPVQMRGYRRAKLWKRHIGDTVTVEVAGVSVKCWAREKSEFLRALSFQDDTHLLQALTAQCQPGSICWDVGANLGHYTLLFSQVVGREGRVFAFEPEPRVREQLMENLSLINAANVTVVPMGLSDRSGREIFFTAKDSASGTHSLISQRPDGESITIELLPADEYLRAGELCPNVVKIDVEGAELSVIKGMKNVLSNPSLKAVLCEVHFQILEESGQLSAPAEIMRRLRDAGLSNLCWIDSSHLLALRLVAT